MRVEKCAFLLHNCILPFLFLPSEGVKNCPRSHFFCSPHHFSRFSSLKKLPPAPSRQYITDYNRDKETDMKLKYGLVTSAIEANAEDCCYISIDDMALSECHTVPPHHCEHLHLPWWCEACRPPSSSSLPTQGTSSCKVGTMWQRNLPIPVDCQILHHWMFP